MYVLSFRALGNDIKANLMEPLREIEEIVLKNSHKMQQIHQAVRSRDNSMISKEMNRIAPHILITTPESLGLMLCAPKFSEKTKEIEIVIIDEIHALADNILSFYKNRYFKIIKRL